MAKKYMAYVGSYSYTGEAKGITVYDIDMKSGAFKKRGEVEINNASYLVASNDKKTLYSIADEGIVAFRILENGSITRLNSADIKGMRGCHLSIDSEGKYIFVSGYHDGKLTALSLNKDGSIGDIIDGIYHKGIGTRAVRNFRPHITCTRMTPDRKFVLSVDSGTDQVKVYKFNDQNLKFDLADTIRCELDSSPKFFEFSKDGKFIYLLCEMTNNIDVYKYSYKEKDELPKFEKIQTMSSMGDKKPTEMTAATCIDFTNDKKYLFVGNAGDNNVSFFKVDEKSGKLTPAFCLPISGEYPKDIVAFPDDKHLASINHISGTISCFNIDFNKSIITMSSNIIKVNQPNCCTIVEV